MMRTFLGIVLALSVLYPVAMLIACVCLRLRTMFADRRHQQQAVPFVEDLREPAEPEPECYIIANDYEFIPARIADVRPGEKTLSPAFYRDMQAAEAAARRSKSDV